MCTSYLGSDAIAVKMDGENKIAVEVENLTYGYHGGKSVLRNVNLEVCGLSGFGVIQDMAVSVEPSNCVRNRFQQEAEPFWSGLMERGRLR
jgi:hypothetical protein